MASTLGRALESWMARHKLLSILCGGGSIRSAAADMGTSRRSIMRYLAANPEFAEACRTAKELARSDDPLAIEALLWSVMPPEEAGPAPQALEAVQIVPAPPAVDPDVVPGRPSDDPNLLVPGLPPLTERNLLAECWRGIFDKKEATGYRVACMRALGEQLLERRRRLPQPGLQPAVETGRAGRPSDPGVPANVWLEARRNFLGPAPDDGEGDGDAQPPGVLARQG